MVFMWLYIFTSSIVLVNLLIAMFSETYNRVSSLAEQEYQHMFFDKVQQHGQSAPLAVPQLAPCAFSGRAWRLRAARHSQGEPRPLRSQPRPRVLELAASKVAYFTLRLTLQVQEHQHVLLALPPVLNLPYVWFDMLRRMWPCGLGCLCRSRKPAAEPQPPSATTSERRSQLRRSTTETWDSEMVPQEASITPGTVLGRSERHVHVDPLADAQAHGFDGRALVEVYLAQQAELDSQTLPARAASLGDAIEEAKRERSHFFCDAKTRLQTLEKSAEVSTELREQKTDPENRDQAERIKRIEVCIGKIMTALNIQEEVAEVLPPAPVKQRRRRLQEVPKYVPPVIWNLGQNVANLAQNAASATLSLSQNAANATLSLARQSPTPQQRSSTTLRDSLDTVDDT